MIEAVMSLYIKEVLIPEKVIQVVNRFLPLDDDVPEEAEDAALFWINKSCLKFKERIEEELEKEVVTPTTDVVPNIPFSEYLWDLSDGCCLASLLAFYCPEELSWKEICFNEPMSPADSNYNLQLVEIFCQERLPCDIFFLDVEDIYRCHPVIRPNMLALIADLLFHLEIRPAPCVKTPGPDLFNMLFMTSDEEERFAREEQLPSMNGRFSSREQLNRQSTWQDKPRRSSLTSRRQGYDRSLSQDHYEDDTLDSDDLSHYMTALDIKRDSPSDLSAKTISGPQSIAFSVNRNARNSLPGSHGKLSTYSRGSSPGKRLSSQSNVVHPMTDYLSNRQGESSSSGEDGVNQGVHHRIRASFSNGTPARVLNRNELSWNRDPYHRSVHNLPTDALAAASASVNDIPRAGLSRSNSTTTTPNYHLLNHETLDRLTKSREFLASSQNDSSINQQNNGMRSLKTPNKESPVTSFNSSHDGMYVRTGGLDSHALPHLEPSRSGSAVYVGEQGVGQVNHELHCQGLPKQDLRSDSLQHSTRSNCSPNDSSRLRNCILTEDHLNHRKRKSGEDHCFESLQSNKRSESMAAVDALRHAIQSPFHQNNSPVNSHHLSHQNLSTLINQTPGSSKTFNLRAIEEELRQNKSTDDPYSSLLRQSSNDKIFDDGEVTLDINDIRVMLDEKRKRIERERLLQEEQWVQEVERQSIIHQLDDQTRQPSSLRSQHCNLSNPEDQQPPSLVRLREQTQQTGQQRKSWFIPSEGSPTASASVIGQDLLSPAITKATYMNIPWEQQHQGDSSPSVGRTSSVNNKFTTVNLCKASTSVSNVQRMSSPQTESGQQVPQAEGFVIGSELSVPSQEDELSMARKKEMVIQQSLKRKAEQEAKRIKQQEEQSRKREEDRRRAEELDRKREEEKRRKQIILQEYKMKKAKEDEEKRTGGPSISSTVVLKRNPPKARPKSLHVNSSMLQDYASLDSKPSKLTMTPSTDTVDRSASHVFSDGVSSFGGSSVSSKKQPAMNSTGSSRPPSVVSCSSRLTSPPSSSHALSLMPSMPTLYQRRGPPSDGGSETGSAFSEYNGPKLYSKPAQKSNRQIILNAINVVLAGSVNADMKKHVLEVSV